MCIYLAPYEYYTPQRGPVVILSYWPAPLLRQLCLDTERISVPFSSKCVKHMAYLAHVGTVVYIYIYIYIYYMYYIYIYIYNCQVDLGEVYYEQRRQQTSKGWELCQVV